MIYLILNESNTKCKIGVSKNPKLRLKQLQTGSSENLRIDIIINGDFCSEKELHKNFSTIREKGEWFIYTQEIQQYFHSKTPTDIIIFDDENVKYLIPNSAVFQYLLQTLTSVEFCTMHKMCLLAQEHTYSLKPLNDKMYIQDLVEILGVSKNKVKPVLNKLLTLGVYTNTNTNYWILNPYLQFNGKVIDKSIADLFKGTIVAKAFRGEIK